MPVDLKREMFGPYDYDTTLAYFRYTLHDPEEVRNGETRGEWFARCHDISCNDFKQIVKAREPDWFYRKVDDTSIILDLNQPRKNVKKLISVEECKQ